jgi:hypothetical protein
MAGATGLEPAASCVRGRRSNQTSYIPAFDYRTGSGTGVLYRAGPSPPAEPDPLVRRQGIGDARISIQLIPDWKLCDVRGLELFVDDAFAQI